MECSVLDSGVVDNDAVQQEPPRLKASVITGVILLVARGVLLWLVVPAAVLGWLVGWPYWNRRNATFGQVVGWADLNLVAALQRGPLRPLVVNRWLGRR